MAGRGSAGCRLRTLTAGSTHPVGSISALVAKFREFREYGELVADERAVNRVTATQIISDSRPLLDAECGELALPLWPGESADDAPWVGPGGELVADQLGLDLFDSLEREKATGKAGEIVAVPVVDAGRGAASVDGDVDVRRVVLVGLGDGSTTSYRKAGAALARACRDRERVATTIGAGADDAGMRAFVEGAVLATFALGEFRSKPLKNGTTPLGALVLVGLDDDRAATATAASAIASAGWFARELVHTPSNVKDPAWLAEQAVKIGKSTRLTVRVRDEKTLQAEGFGGIIGVGQGSDRPPRLIALRYEPTKAANDAPHVVLVGKGITFDSGGLSLKPRTSMVGMKTDMSGGAVVLGVMSALRDLGVGVRVTGLVPAAENLPGAAAQRPSDVIKQYDGTTVEVLNTDAEGRLVLADALAYAVSELDPSVMVDVATLTGAATVALGRTHAAMYATSDDLAAALAEAGKASGERLWRMPLLDEYRVALDSEIADLANVETRPVGAGSITAALFLREFVGGVPWAHLDIAGPGRAEKDKDEVVKGGTAFGVRALLYWLESGAPMG